MTKLQKAIDRLAALYEFGHLSASTDPASFLGEVSDELERLRSANVDREVLRDALADAVDAWDLREHGVNIKLSNGNIDDISDEVLHVLEAHGVMPQKGK